MSSDLTSIANEPGMTLRDRFGVLLWDDTRYFDWPGRILLNKEHIKALNKVTR